MPPDEPEPWITPEMIERFRQTGLRLDREGRFWHEGAEVTHAGFRRALLRWLDVRPEDGRPILRLDERRYAYVDVDDTHLLVTSARWEGSRVIIVTNDEAEQELEYGTLSVAGDDSLRCRVRGGRLVARFTTPAYYALAEGIEEGDGTFVLNAAGRQWEIGRAS